MNTHRHIRPSSLLLSTVAGVALLFGAAAQAQSIDLNGKTSTQSGATISGPATVGAGSNTGVGADVRTQVPDAAPPRTGRSSDDRDPDDSATTFGNAGTGANAGAGVNSGANVGTGVDAGVAADGYATTGEAIRDARRKRAEQAAEARERLNGGVGAGAGASGNAGVGADAGTGADFGLGLESNTGVGVGLGGNSGGGLNLGGGAKGGLGVGGL